MQALQAHMQRPHLQPMDNFCLVERPTIIVGVIYFPTAAAVPKLFCFCLSSCYTDHNFLEHIESHPMVEKKIRMDGCHITHVPTVEKDEDNDINVGNILLF